MAALIAAQRVEHQIPHAVACRALGVSRSWFYKWNGGALPPQAQRRQRLAAEVARLFTLHAGKYGSPRITADLRDAGWRVSENTVAALMRELGVAARRSRKRRSATRPAATMPTMVPSMKALNTNPYRPSPCRSRATSGITVTTARASAATKVTVAARPAVRGRRCAAQRPPARPPVLTGFRRS